MSSFYYLIFIITIIFAIIVSFPMTFFRRYLNNKNYVLPTTGPINLEYNSNNVASTEEFLDLQEPNYVPTPTNDNWESLQNDQVLSAGTFKSKEPVSEESLNKQLINLNSIDTDTTADDKFNDNFKNIVIQTIKQNIKYLLSDNNNYETHLSYPDNYVQDILKNMKGNETSGLKDLCNFGIKILDMHLTSQRKKKFYMNSLINIIKNINKIIVPQVNINDNIPETDNSNWDNTIYRLLILLAMYEYIGYNNLNKLSTCHNVIKSIIQKFHESVGMPFDNDIKFICLTIPTLLTDYLYDRHNFHDKIKEAVGYLENIFYKVDYQNNFYFSIYTIFSNELNN